MTTDITELVQSLKAAATNVKETAHIARYLKATIARQTFKELMTPDNILALVEALEYYKSREERVTSLVRDNSKSWDELYRQVEAKGKRNVELVEALESEKRICATWRKTAKSTGEKLEKAQTINAAAEKLVRCKGRYHSEKNYRALAALFGVKTPDLPPLEHENVHYADAAEMEIAALRQRIAELESRIVTVKLASRRLPSDYVDGEFGNDDLAAIHNACRLECKVSVEKYLSAYGIVVKWEDE